MTPDPKHPFADFRNFLFAVWKHLNLPVPTPVQYDIAHYLQHGPTRCIIEAFRGVGKSYVTSAFVVWCLYWDPTLKIMVVSASKERADAFSQFCLRLICDMPELQHLIPRSGQRRSLVAFDVNGAGVDHSPSVKSVGITGQLTGSRADLIIADDIETPKNSQTVGQRERIRELVKEFDAVLKPLPQSRVIYLGTPQIEDSIYNELQKRGYSCRIWPARKPSGDKYRGTLAPMIEAMDIPVGAPTDPIRFDQKDLDRREASYGKAGFALQFMLDTSLSDADKFPLRCSDFILMDVDKDMAPAKVIWASGPDQQTETPCVGLHGDRWYAPMYVSKEFANYTSSVMFIDPSGRGADKTAFVVIKYLNGMLFVRRWAICPGGYDEMTLTMLANIAKVEQVQQILVEPNFGDGMFVQLLKPYLQRLYPCAIEDGPRATIQKEKRIIDTLEPVLMQHRLVIDRAIVESDRQNEVEHQGLYQLTRITRDKNSLGHDDLIDALAGGVAFFSKMLDVNHDNAEEQLREAALQREIERFIENAGLQGGLWGSGTPNFLAVV